jgi:transcriptional regulator with XRE-family HTH domain
MNPTSIPDLISRLIAVNGGNAQQAAARLGTSAASLSRWRSGNARPRKHLEDRLRAIVDGSGDLVALAERTDEDARLVRLDEAISGTIHALREEFHRTASVSTRQEVLDLVAALFFAHVTSIDSGARGIGDHLPFAYISCVMQKIAEGWPNSRIDELMPWAWSPVAQQKAA